MEIHRADPAAFMHPTTVTGFCAVAYFSLAPFSPRHEVDNDLRVYLIRKHCRSVLDFCSRCLTGNIILQCDLLAGKQKSRELSTCANSVYQALFPPPHTSSHT